MLLPLAGQAIFFVQPASAGRPVSANEQEGDIESNTEQAGGSNSGDAVAGQVTGTVVDGGSTQVDATNSSRDVDVESGEASGSNTADAFVGQSESGGDEATAVGNYQDGDNESDIAQAANATSGDAVGGQVIGVVSSGDTDIVASNTSEDIDVTTGDSLASNDANVFIGLLSESSDDGLQFNLCLLADCDNASVLSANNTQGSDNSSDLSQISNATSGDGVGGQVIGVVSPGNTNIDATNSSRDVDIETGDAFASNDADVNVGLVAEASNEGLQFNICGIPIDSTSLTLAVCTNIAEASANNTQDGDNASDLAQAADATSGDGVGGQVIGVVSSAGTTDIVAANTSEDVDIETGDADSSNSAFVDVGPRATATNEGVQANVCGIAIDSEITLTTPVCINTATADATNSQEGDNASDLAQASEATSGDGVGGQVIGVVSSGNTTIEATNSSDDIDIETGDADSSNVADVLVGARAIAGNEGIQANVCGNQIDTSGTVIIVLPIPSVSDATCVNVADSDAANDQDGDNDSAVSQASNAASGDGVGGQVIGAVTSGTTDIVAANTSEDIDVETGDADSSNSVLNDVGPVPSASNDVTQVNLCSNQIGVFLSTSESTCVNASISDASIDQTGDNESDLTQTAEATTGDGVGGQVIGAVSSGTTSIDATNSSQDVDIETGDADASNNADVVAGPTSSAENVGTQINACANQLEFDDETGGDRADADATCVNVGVADAELIQEGDNGSDLTQSANATTGDGVGGQVIGAVTSGTTDIVAANTSEDVDIETGDADASNGASVIAGATSLAGNDGTQANVCANQIEPNGATGAGNRVEAEAFCLNAAISDADNAQTGDNGSDLAQAADASTGDGVGGQVIGVVSSGDTSIDATNSSQDVDIETGDADASNEADVVVGALAEASNEGLQLNLCGNQIAAANDSETDATCINFALGLADNDQDGDNASDLSQSAAATTGDGVGGQVIGAVTSGTTDIVAANTSEDVDIETGDADASNDADVAVGPDAAAENVGAQVNVCSNQIGVIDSDTTSLCVNAAIATADNEQEGDNSADVAQAADATTGDGVGGQVIGAVSAGDTSIDATNSSQDVDVETGDADASNGADVVVGLLAEASNEGIQLHVCGNQLGSEELNTDANCFNFAIVTADNFQIGDNESELTQASNASSGDGVAGQVVGVVTSLGGSADLVVANTSEDVDLESGDGDQDNDDTLFVGLQASGESEEDGLFVGG